MFAVVDKVVYGMALLRFTSSIIEFSGAFLMLYFGTAPKALQVNGALSLVGPFVLVAVTALGISGVSGTIHWSRISFIVIGVACILLGARQ
jgi:hypothetical protein